MTSSSIPPLLLANLLVGTAMLLFGRKLFWVFVAGTGFCVGALLAAEGLGPRGDWQAVAVALVAGLAGAAVALYAQKIAVGIAGILAGAYLGYILGTAAQFDIAPWIAAVAGGIVGGLVLSALFNWALMALSSLVGAAVIAQTLPLARPWPTLVFVVLLGVGIVLQARQHRRNPPAPAKKER